MLICYVPLTREHLIFISSGFQVSQVDLKGEDRVVLEQTILTYTMMEMMICTVRTNCVFSSIVLETRLDNIHLHIRLSVFLLNTLFVGNLLKK